MGDGKGNYSSVAVVLFFDSQFFYSHTSPIFRFLVVFADPSSISSRIIACSWCFPLEEDIAEQANIAGGGENRTPFLPGVIMLTQQQQSPPVGESHTTLVKNNTRNIYQVQY